MSSRCKLRSYGRVLLVTTLVVSLTSSSWAGGFFRNGAVGGVIINSQGVLTQPTAKASRELGATMRDMVQPADGQMAEASELRRISLRQLSEMVAEAVENNHELPSEVRYLAGSTPLPCPRERNERRTKYRWIDARSSESSCVY